MLYFYRTGLISGAAAIILFTACSSGDPAADEKALARAYLQGIIVDQKWDQWNEYFSPDVTFNGTRFSREALRATSQGLHLAFPDLTLEIEDQMADGDKVITRMTFSGTHLGLFNTLAPTERPVRFQAIAIDQIRGDRVVAMWHQLDMWSIVRQLTSGDPESLVDETGDVVED